MEIMMLIPSSEEESYVDVQPEPEEGEVGVAEEEPVRRRIPGVNLAHLKAVLHYRVKRKADGTIDENSAFTYFYRQYAIRAHARRLSERALCRIAASQDFTRWLTDGRGESVVDFKSTVQEAFDDAGLGLEVVYAGIPVVHPPAEVAEEYEGTVVAMQHKEATRYVGESQANQLVQGAHAMKSEMLQQARSYAVALSATAEAERQEFLAQFSTYAIAPEVHRFRYYCDIIERYLPYHKMYVMPSTANEVQIIDLQERVSTDLLDLTEGQVQ
jgi:regulator of protease activity HflC (stomatin/prohibitin superfamily)